MLTLTLSLAIFCSFCGCSRSKETTSSASGGATSSAEYVSSDDSQEQSSSEQTSSDELISSEEETYSDSSHGGISSISTAKNPNIGNQTSSRTPAPVNSTSAPKQMTAEQGQNYLLLAPKVNHPGVAEMDAEYEFVCTDKLENNILPVDFELKANISAVKIDGCKVTVPWAIRKSGQQVTITASLKKEPLKKGSYTFTFRQYTAAPTFFDDFNGAALNTDVWEPVEHEIGPEGQKVTIKDLMGEVKDGSLVFTVENAQKMPAGQRFEIYTKNFKQAYGCFTARIDMPNSGNGNAAFWMMTFDGDRYIKNPAMPSVSGGEIDVVEYFGTWGNNRWSTALHWNAWHPSYLSSAGNDNLPGPNIQNGYHTFSVVWTDSAMYWYYDGTLARVYTGSGVAKGSGGMRMLLQLAPEYKDGWGGKYDPTDYPYTMKTDYVKAYAFT